MTTPLSWVKRIVSELPELNTIPLFGNAPPFDWSVFTEALKTRFGLSQIAIRAKDQAWQEADLVTKGLGSELHIIPITIAPLGAVYWMMSESDLEKLTSSMMRSTQKPRPPLSEIFQEGFYQFVIVQSLDILSEMSPFADLTLQISHEEEEGEKAFCIDVEIQIGDKTAWGRLAIPDRFRAKWIEHFSTLPPTYFPQEVAKQTFLNLSIKTGAVTLDQEQWKTIQPGDFVLLDQESYDAHKGSGVCLLLLNETPLFNAKIKQGKVELIDYAYYYEDKMEKKPSQEMSLKELPLHVTVEIARLKMTLDKLMHLTPGNTLELPIHPDQGVTLTINGQTVGKAELVYLGEQLGIRILEI